MREIVFIIFVVMLSSCSEKQQSPEEVLEEYMVLISQGKCEQAKSLSTEAMKETLQGSIDAGCEPWDMEIVSIDCQTTGNKSACCYRDKRPTGEMEFGYYLEIENGSWKVSGIEPYLGGPCIKSEQ